MKSHQQEAKGYNFTNSDTIYENTGKEAMDKHECLTATLNYSLNDGSKWQETSTTADECQVKDHLEMTVVAEVYATKV